MAQPDLDKVREDFNRATGGSEASIPSAPEKLRDHGSPGDDDKAWAAAMETRRQNEMAEANSTTRKGHTSLAMPKDDSQTHVFNQPDSNSPEAAASARRAANPNSVP